MRYEDDDVDFLTDNKVGEKQEQEQLPRRRGGAYLEENTKKKKYEEKDEDEENSTFSNIIMAVAIIVIIIAVIVMIIALKPKKENSSNDSNPTSTTEEKDSGYVNIDNSSKDKEEDNNSIVTSNVEDKGSYNAYPLEIESVVYKKNGDFYNNPEGIKGDKVYVEYKQISGLKDKEKEKIINEKLEKLSTDLYDKNYLSDKEVLFIDIITKISVNFNTISCVAIRTGEDIDGKPLANKVASLNIKIDDLKEIQFEELFKDSANIKSMYSEYVKGKVENYYFTPEKIYVYNKTEEKEIDISKNYSSIALYNAFDTNAQLFTSNAVSQKNFSILKSTVSTETKDRAFTKSK